MKSSLDLCPCDLQRVFGKNRAWQWQCLWPEWRLSCVAAGWSRLMRAMEDASRTQTPWYCVPQSSTSHYHTIFTAFFRKPPLEFSVLLVLLTPNLGFKDFLAKRAGLLEQLHVFDSLRHLCLSNLLWKIVKISSLDFLIFLRLYPRPSYTSRFISPMKYWFSTWSPYGIDFPPLCRIGEGMW